MDTARQHEDDAVSELMGSEKEDAIRRAYRMGMERSAQKARYYLKHQNIGFNGNAHESTVKVTCQNIEDIINDEAESLGGAWPTQEPTK